MGCIHSANSVHLLAFVPVFFLHSICIGWAHIAYIFLGTLSVRGLVICCAGSVNHFPGAGCLLHVVVPLSWCWLALNVWCFLVRGLHLHWTFVLYKLSAMALSVHCSLCVRHDPRCVVGRDASRTPFLGSEAACSSWVLPAHPIPYSRYCLASLTPKPIVTALTCGKMAPRFAAWPWEVEGFAGGQPAWRLLPWAGF